MLMFELLSVEGPTILRPLHFETLEEAQAEMRQQVAEFGDDHALLESNWASAAYGGATKDWQIFETEEE